MQKIVPSLWFDHVAADAANFYAEAIPGTTVTDTQYYPMEGLLDFQQEFAGKELTVEFEVQGYRFVAINAGPEFRANPSVSFMLNFDPSRDQRAREHLDAVWAALSDGGNELMPLGEYEFSPHYGWIQDRFGMSWQLILTDPAGEPRPFVIPNLLFGGSVQNRAADAMDYYTSVFEGATTGDVWPYPDAVGPATAESIMFGELNLFGQWFALMDSAVEQHFTFNPGVSLMLQCEDQDELDRYWHELSAVPEAEQCGWLVDRFGLSWQVVPANMSELMQAPGSFEKLLAMRKIEISAF
jgi:predicted 3-demethylubiquinone-9 3-methyltransferase (glyoxalase superfamily)